jgi:hypothetical protein
MPLVPVIRYPQSACGSDGGPNTPKRGGVKEKCRRIGQFPSSAHGGDRRSHDATALAAAGVADAIEQSPVAQLMSPVMRALSGGLLLGAWLALAPAWAAPEAEKPAAAVTTSTAPAPPESRPKIGYRDDKVSVEARDADLGEILHGIAKESGADLVGTPRAESRVTITLEQAPMAEALERLVGAQNFTLKYDEAGKLKTIELRGGQEAAQRPKPEEKPADENTTPAKWRAFYDAFFGTRPDPIPLSGALKDRIQKDEVGFDYLGNTAIADPDPKIRAAALKAALDALDRDPERKAAVLASLEAMTDAELAEFARKSAHYRAEDLVRNMMRETKDGEVRSRAREVLHELRKIPYHGPLTPMH